MVTLNKRVKKKKKGKLIPYDNEEVEYYIYNNLDIPYYNDEYNKTNWSFKKLLFEDEIAKPMPKIYSGHHFITNYGRILNAKMVKWITIHNVRDRYLIYHLEATRWYLEKTMNECGWEYDMNKLITQYKKMDYPHRKTTYTARNYKVKK